MNKWNLTKVFFIFLLLTAKALAAENNNNDDIDDDPCKGLLSYVDRPSLGDSACVVPLDKIVVEMGFQAGALTNGGSALNFPQPVVRFGLPERTEFAAFLPTYVKAYNPIQTGFSSATFAVAHELLHRKGIVFSVEGLITPPSGGKSFGNEGFGYGANALANIDLPKHFSLAFMAGVGSQTTSEQSGGDRFNYFLPDAVLSWGPTDKWLIYGEVFGLSRTAPDEGAGFIADGGFQYLVTKNFAVDINAGQRISGNLGGTKNFVGAGFAVEI